MLNPKWTAKQAAAEDWLIYDSFVNSRSLTSWYRSQALWRLACFYYAPLHLEPLKWCQLHWAFKYRLLLTGFSIPVIISRLPPVSRYLTSYSFDRAGWTELFINRTYLHSKSNLRQWIQAIILNAKTSFLEEMSFCSHETFKLSLQFYLELPTSIVAVTTMFFCAQIC